MHRATAQASEAPRARGLAASCALMSNRSSASRRTCRAPTSPMRKPPAMLLATYAAELRHRRLHHRAHLRLVEPIGDASRCLASSVKPRAAAPRYADPPAPGSRRPPQTPAPRRPPRLPEAPVTITVRPVHSNGIASTYLKLNFDAAIVARFVFAATTQLCLKSDKCIAQLASNAQCIWFSLKRAHFMGLRRRNAFKVDFMQFTAPQ